MEILNDTGHFVDKVYSIEEIQHHHLKTEYKIILLDIRLALRCRIEPLQELIQQKNHKPELYLLSGMEDMKKNFDVKQLNFKILPKPIDIFQLFRILRK